MAKRKFLFLYLNTGAGHLAPAKVLREQVLKQDPDSEVLLINGFDKGNIFGKALFEKGYFMATNMLHGAFPLFYDFTMNMNVVGFFCALLRSHTVSYLEKVIEKENPTDIVSFHFALSPFARSAILRTGRKINLTVMVTDPFTMPNAWFWDRKLDYYVFSEDAKKIAVEQKVPENQVTVVPYVVNSKYTVAFNKNDVAALKEKHGFDKNKKVVLIVGGGAGLPGAIEIINKCAFRHAKFAIAIVCGKDFAKKKYLEGFSKLHPKLDLHVYGFVNFLDELVKISDCVVSKAGTSLLFEVLSSRKPLIISHYIHDQELGNMRFAVRNKVGYFIQKPGAIYDKVEELLEDENFDARMAANFDNLKIDTDSSKIARLLLEK